MSNNWEQWEGRTVDGKFVVGNYVGSSDDGAVFRARGVDGEPADAAIKFVAVDWEDAEEQLARWKTASELQHPNLIRLFGQGRYAVDGREFVYVVEEYAEENLGQIVPERALNGEEARGMLVPVLAALEYVHNKGLAHGRIRPSNILAAGDQVKLSSDSLGAAGNVPETASAYDAPEVATHGISAASDVWALGITLVEVLTQHVPAWDAARMRAPEVGEEIPEPFRSIARRCLEIDPARRCSVREIGDRLEGRKPAGEVPRIQEADAPSAVAAAQKQSAKWPYWVAAVVIAAVAFFILRPRPSGGPEGEATTGAPTGAQTAAAPSAPAPSPPAQSQEAQAAGAQTKAAAPEAARRESPGRAQGGKARSDAAAKDDVVERAMPEVSPSARRTIQGKIKVRVRVNVDAAGKVTQATLKEAGPSKYFARVALEAARRWTFVPAQDEGRTWTLLFAFSRARTEASAARAR